MTQFFKVKDNDDVAIRNSLSAKDIIQLLSLEDVYNFLLSLGLDESNIDIQKDHIICPTICHNPLDEATNMKLYYYDKNKSFHCYTQCSENFNIIELYMRYMRLNHYEVYYSDAEDYVRQFVGNVSFSVPIMPKHAYERVKVQPQEIIDLPYFENSILDCFPHYHHPLWLADGISEKSMDKFQIGFSISQNKITIPHYDYRGKLVGIRGRAISEADLEFGKYRPMMVGEKMYNHQLGFNLYGIWENREAIKKYHQAIIFESEKSVMLSDTYYGDNSVAVATCGSQLNRFQVNLLIKKFGVYDITLAFDKEYENLRDPACQAYRQKLIDKCKKYFGLANFYYIFDEHDLINRKDSPIDKGQETFEKLFKKRIRIK